MGKPGLVIFDLSGTTVKDRGEVADSFTAALSEHVIGVPARGRAAGGQGWRDIPLAHGT